MQVHEGARLKNGDALAVGDSAFELTGLRRQWCCHPVASLWPASPAALHVASNRHVLLGCDGAGGVNLVQGRMDGLPGMKEPRFLCYKYYRKEGLTASGRMEKRLTG